MYKPVITVRRQPGYDEEPDPLSLQYQQDVDRALVGEGGPVRGVDPQRGDAACVCEVGWDGCFTCCPGLSLDQTKLPRSSRLLSKYSSLSYLFVMQGI